MKPPVAKKIGSNTYTVTPLGAKKGCQVFTRLTKILAGALKDGVAVKDGVADKMQLLANGMASLREEDMDFFCNEFSAYTTVTADESPNKSPRLSDIFDLHFQADYAVMVEWLLHCLEVNFGSFFVEAAAAAAARKAAAEAATASS